VWVCPLNNLQFDIYSLPCRVWVCPLNNLQFDIHSLPCPVWVCPLNNLQFDIYSLPCRVWVCPLNNLQFDIHSLPCPVWVCPLNNLQFDIYSLPCPVWVCPGPWWSELSQGHTDSAWWTETQAQRACSGQHRALAGSLFGSSTIHENIVSFPSTNKAEPFVPQTMWRYD